MLPSLLTRSQRVLALEISSLDIPERLADALLYVNAKPRELLRPESTELGAFQGFMGAPQRRLHPFADHLVDVAIANHIVPVSIRPQALFTHPIEAFLTKARLGKSLFAESLLP
jgi:hypothetical protein